MKKFFILMLFVSVACLIFYGCFFCLAPFICGKIPVSVGEWKGIIDIVVYVFIAWIGGVGIPFSILLAGIIISLKS